MLHYYYKLVCRNSRRLTCITCMLETCIMAAQEIQNKEKMYNQILETNNYF